MNHKNTFYIGVVIQNNDPERRNRCKIFIPSITSYGVDLWIRDTKNKDRQILLDDILDPNKDMQQILLELKKVLPWAEYAGGIFGGNSSFVYDSNNKKMIEIERPGDQYSNIRGNLNRNKYDFTFNTKPMTGTPSGIFSIPNVGSCVWCYFHNNNYNSPVYFAASYGDMDINKIYSHNKNITTDQVIVNYPGNFENIEN